jgi:hypothetical protein
MPVSLTTPILRSTINPFSKYYLDIEPTLQTARMGHWAKQLNGGFRSDVANTRTTACAAR